MVRKTDYDYTTLHLENVTDAADNSADKSENCIAQTSEEADNTDEQDVDVDVEGDEDVGTDVEDGGEEDFETDKDVDEEPIHSLDEGSLSAVSVAHQPIYWRRRLTTMGGHCRARREWRR